MLIADWARSCVIVVFLVHCFLRFFSGKSLIETVHKRGGAKTALLVYTLQHYPARTRATTRGVQLTYESIHEDMRWI